MSKDVPVGYKLTEVGVIPEDWEVKRLKHISPSQSVGLVINPSSYFDEAGSVPMLVGSHIHEDHIDYESANLISAFSNNLLTSSRLSAGDIVTVRVGYPGVTAVIPPELDRCNCASMMIVRQHACFFSPWLCYVMNSRIGRYQIEHVQYGTAQKQFNISDAVNFVYPFPSLLEQKAIALVLSDTDALITSLDKLIAKKRDIKQAAMQQLLTGKQRLEGFGDSRGKFKQTEIGLIPEDWEIDRVESFVSITTGNRNTQDRIEDGQYPFFVRSQTIERINSYSFDGEAVLTAGDGVGTGKVFHYINGKFDCHQRVYKISNFGSSLLSMLIYAQNDCWQRLEPKIYYR